MSLRRALREEVPNGRLAGQDTGRDILEEPAILTEDGIKVALPVECPPELGTVPEEHIDVVVEIIATEESRLFDFADLNFRMCVQQ